MADTNILKKNLIDLINKFGNFHFSLTGLRCKGLDRFRRNHPTRCRLRFGRKNCTQRTNHDPVGTSQ
jgi:hypothetical protein